MKNDSNTVIEIMGKSFQIKCAESEVQALRRSAEYLEEKMQVLQSSSPGVSFDRLALIVGLNIVNQVLILESQTKQLADRLIELQNKLEQSLERQVNMELI